MSEGDLMWPCHRVRVFLSPSLLAYIRTRASGELFPLQLQPVYIYVSLRRLTSSRQSLKLFHIREPLAGRRARTPDIGIPQRFAAARLIDVLIRNIVFYYRYPLRREIHTYVCARFNTIRASYCRLLSVVFSVF